MIKILHRNSRYVPVVVCDVCQQLITDATDAAAVYLLLHPSGDFLDDESIGDVLHVHKENCMEIGEYILGGREYTGWGELGTHLRHLVMNVGMDLDDMQEMNDYEDKFGIL